MDPLSIAKIHAQNEEYDRVLEMIEEGVLPFKTAYGAKGLYFGPEGYRNRMGELLDRFYAEKLDRAEVLMQRLLDIQSGKYADADPKFMAMQTAAELVRILKLVDKQLPFTEYNFR